MIGIYIHCFQEVGLPPKPTQPPKDEVDKSSMLLKNLPNRAATVHMGKERREKIDQELKNFKGATEAYSSHPFNKGEHLI